MASVNFSPPPSLHGTAEEQLAQLHRFLFMMVEQMNAAHGETDNQITQAFETAQNARGSAGVNEAVDYMRTLVQNAQTSLQSQIDETVHYTPENRTDAEKAVARTNIGAADETAVVKTINSVGPDENGNVDIQGGGGGEAYVLPTASATVKGGVKIGSGLEMTGEVLSVADDAFQETDPTVPEWAKNPTKPAYTAEEVGAIDAVDGQVYGYIRFPYKEGGTQYRGVHWTTSDGTAFTIRPADSANLLQINTSNVAGAVKINTAGEVTLSKPLALSGGISTFGNSIQSGTASISSVANGAIGDTAVTFTKAFSGTPFVIICPRSSSEAATYGGLLLSVVSGSESTTGFTARCYNNSGSSKTPGFRWIAIGAM